MPLLIRHKLFGGRSRERQAALPPSVCASDEDDDDDGRRSSASGTGDNDPEGRKLPPPPPTSRVPPCFRYPKEIWIWAKNLRKSGPYGKSCGDLRPPQAGEKGRAPRPSPSFSDALLRNLEEAREVLKTKVSETARAWTSSSGLPSLIGGNHHQRLGGATGDEPLSPVSPSHEPYQSSPTLIERGRDKSANLFSGGHHDGGYQRLDDQSADRKNSWGDGWGPDWLSSEQQDGAAIASQEEEHKRLSASPQSNKRPTSVRKTSQGSLKENEKENLLLDFDSPSSPTGGKKTKSGSANAGGGHTWDNWDDDGWEKVE